MWLPRDDGLLELTTRRAGLRTHATVLRDGVPVAEGAGLVRVLVPLCPDGAGPLPAVLVLAPLPGIAGRAMLLLPRTDGTSDGPAVRGFQEAAARAAVELPAALSKVAGLAASERVPFEPAPGTFAARLRRFQREHPHLWAARHVVLATCRVLAGLLGVVLFLQLVLRQLLAWLSDHLPDLDLPDIPWPDVDLPSIPWPDVDLPDVSLPGWLLALVGTAKFWVPILVAVVLAVREVRRRKQAPVAAADAEAGPSREDDAPDANRRP
ncbi:MAG TPA: hypothetical protein VFG13_00430 [Blastococcus sp.]|nr:hypothetical protein [Blastococcus sp.]